MNITLRNEDLINLPINRSKVIPYSFDDYANTKKALRAKAVRIAKEQKMLIYNHGIIADYTDTRPEDINKVDENCIIVDDELIKQMIIVIKDSRSLCAGFYTLCNNLITTVNAIRVDRYGICGSVTKEINDTINAISHHVMPYINYSTNRNFAGLYMDLFDAIIRKNFPNTIIAEFDDSNGRNTFSLYKT